VEVKLCIDLNEYDLVMLVQAARAAKMPLDALVKKAIFDYVERILTPTPPPTQPPPKEPAGGER